MRPEVIIAIGIPASGKTTLRAKYRDYAVISPDEIRKGLFGVTYDKAIEPFVWDIAFEWLECYTLAGVNVYFDATSISKWARARIMEVVDRRRVKVIAHYLPVSVKTALKRNLERDRHVPEEVIISMAERLEPPTIDEGFKEIRVGY